MTQTPILETDTGLTAADRCDRCGAQAQARVQFIAGELLFCGHHLRANAAAIAHAVKVPRSL